MNNRAALRRIEAALDESKFVDTLVAGFVREPQGLKTSTEMIRLLVIGLLVSIEELKTATVAGAYRALIKVLDTRDQLRLGVKTGPGPSDFIDRDRLYYAAALLTGQLAYGPSAALEFEPEEIERRMAVVLTACNDLLDYTASATEGDDHVLALDATAVWAWGRGKYYPKPTDDEINAQEDELIRQSLIELRDGKGDVKDLEGATVTDDAAKLERQDGDAAWSGATAKNGGTKRFFGYFAHTLVRAPENKLKIDPGAMAPIVRRVEVVRATDDVVVPSLRMLDSLTFTVRSADDEMELLVDRHYSNKRLDRWQVELIKRHIRQVLDLRSTDYNIVRVEGMPALAGDLYCVATEPSLLEGQRPGVFATDEEHKAYQARRAVADKRTMVVLNSMNEKGSIKYRCPARGYKVACPLFPPSMLVAAERGLDIINPQFANMPLEDLPRCCTQDSFRITLPEQVAKLNQPYTFGTAEWYKMNNRRTYVESAYGNMKNPGAENLRRGSIQRSGLAWNQLVVALVAFNYNVRMIRNRHARLGSAVSNQPLLSADSESVTHVSLTAQHEVELFDAYVAGIDIEDLEIRPTALGGQSKEPARRSPDSLAQQLKVWTLTSQSTSATNGVGHLQVL